MGQLGLHRAASSAPHSLPACLGACGPLQLPMTSIGPLLCLTSKPDSADSLQISPFLKLSLCICRYLKLAVVPDNTPLPMTMLVKLWRVSGEQDAEATANLMEQGGIMRVACLYDGSAWALVDSGHLKHLQVGWLLALIFEGQGCVIVSMQL